jgi:hypothetical protein
MTRKNTKLTVATPVVPQEIQNLFGKRPLVSGEEPELYDALLSRVAVAVSPTDIIEWLYVKDVVDLTWGIHRLRRFAAAIVDNGRQAARDSLLYNLESTKNARILKMPIVCIERVIVHPRSFPEENITKEENQREEKSGSSKPEPEPPAEPSLDEDSITAEAFRQNIDPIEAIERMTAATEARREKMLREIERHQESLGRRMREVMETESNQVPQLPDPIQRSKGNPVIEIQQPPPKDKKAA